MELSRIELRRSATDVKICGVCGGIAEFFGIDSNLVRLIWVAISLFAGTGILLYIIAAVLMPKAQNEVVNAQFWFNDEGIMVVQDENGAMAMMKKVK